MFNNFSHQMNAIKITSRFHLIPVTVAKVKKTKNKKYFEEVGENKSLFIVGGNAN
jgi:hypothetical protein